MFFRIWTALRYVLVIIGGIWVAFQIYEYLTKPSTQLEADVTFGHFILPPGIEDSLKAQQVLYDKAEILKEIDFAHYLRDIDNDSIRSKVTGDLVFAFSMFLIDNVTTSVPTSYSLFKGYWLANVDNKGSLIAKAVTIKLPFTKYVYILRNGDTSYYGESQEVIRLGDLAPKETARVMAWTFMSPEFEQFEKSSEITLTHEQGVGDIQLRVHVSPYWSWMDRHSTAITWCVVGLVIIALVSILEGYIKRYASLSTDQSE